MLFVLLGCVAFAIALTTGICLRAFILHRRAQRWGFEEGEPDGVASPLRTARHEAGHAVVAMACGVIVEGIEIEPGGGSVGGTAFIQRSRRPITEALIAVGGSVAEGSLWLGKVDAESLAEMDASPVEIAAIRHAAESVLREHRPAVEALAKALVRQGTRIEREELEDIVREASPALAAVLDAAANEEYRRSRWTLRLFDGWLDIVGTTLASFTKRFAKNDSTAWYVPAGETQVYPSEFRLRREPRQRA